MGDHRLISLDFETYYDREYSLRKMTIPQYILDPRFETIMCAVSVDGGPDEIIDGPDFPRWLSQFDPAHTTTVAFNALFDNSILSWVYGFIPARMYDTMGMTRTLLGHKLAKGASLAAVAEVLKLPKKMNTIATVMGMMRHEIKARGLWAEFCEYAKHDNHLNRGIFNLLYSRFPAAERRVADLVLRCAVEPRFQLDIEMLEAHLVEVRQEKADLLTRARTTELDLMSTNKFKDALEAEGVTVEMKTSLTGRQTPAFAKTDKFMTDLLEHDNIAVQALAAARLGYKSTIEETRAEKLIAIASLDWGRYRDGNSPVGTLPILPSSRFPPSGSMPIPLGYGKAHTHRLAGEWGMNMQNLPSSRSGKSKLRKALIAPIGHKVITCDLGQIEARITAWFCGAHDLLTQFADGKDPYAKMGEVIFGYAVDRKVQKVEGFIGKTAILGLGYGCGADKFFDMVVKLARLLKFDLGTVWTPELAEKAVKAYRKAHKEIPAMWWMLDATLGSYWMGRGGIIRIGPVEIGQGYVKGPSHLELQYDNPRENTETSEYEYDYGRSSHKIYGAKLLENIVQFLARIVVMHAALRIRGHAPNEQWSRFVLQAHDELVYIAPDHLVEHAKSVIHSEMIRRPPWAADLPLKADVGVGQSYGEAK